jgi:threonine dehydrogenase-like Zn-dependent dehydrogenase
VCSTDLARRHLPFPLPQVTGHEVVAADAAGTLLVVEINASHAARGLDHGRSCAFCRAGLATHCPERLVLGIHALPGGFAPWLLAPVGGVITVPPAISPATAVLVEPFAAALHAVRALRLRDGDRVAVLGPRRLGSLVIAALAAWRARTGGNYEILAVARRNELRALARALGADEAVDPEGTTALRDLAEVVVETTGSPDGLGLALDLATREVHVKSTTGLPALGLAHLTEMVVDEVALMPFRGVPLESGLPSPPARLAAVLGNDVPVAVSRDLAARGLRVLSAADAASLAALVAAQTDVPWPGADVAVTTSLAGSDALLRPIPSVERGIVRPRGIILVADTGQPRDRLLAAVLDKGLCLTTTRCGDFRAAVEVLADPATGLGHRLGERMITHRFPAQRLADAFAAAADRASIKVVVEHDSESLNQ